MRILIVGAGLAGLALARILARRGVEAEVLERRGPGEWTPRPFILAYHGFDALAEAGVLEELRPHAWEIAPRPGVGPVGLAVSFTRVVATVAAGTSITHRTEVVELLRDGGRTTGVRVRVDGAERNVPADLVVACDGVRSPVRDMAGIPVELTPAEAGHLSFLSPALIDRSFALRYQADGRQVGLIGWPEGSAGWWDVERVGREAALAPGLDAFRQAFVRLIPAARPALDALDSVDQLVYREETLARCLRWWAPGVVVIGDAAHVLGPEAGLGASLGLGDALALAQAITAHPADPDAACEDYERWRRPAVRPYEDIGAAGARIVRGGPKPDEERWPPVAGARA